MEYDIGQPVEYEGQDGEYCAAHMRGMEKAVRDLRRILTLRDTTGQIYEGMTGRPQTQEAE